jgi:hypothetical protein
MPFAFFRMSVFHHDRRGPPPTTAPKSKPLLNWCLFEQRTILTQPATTKE